MKDFETKPNITGRIKKDHINTLRYNLSWVELSNDDKEKYAYALSDNGNDIIYSLDDIEELVSKLENNANYGCDSCTGFCSGDCTIYCADGCSENCSGGCKGNCGDGCTGSCGSSCSVGCGSGCSVDGCTGTCSETCG